MQMKTVAKTFELQNAQHTTKQEKPAGSTDIRDKVSFGYAVFVSSKVFLVELFWPPENASLRILCVLHGEVCCAYSTFKL